MFTTTDEPSALNGTSKLPPIMKKKMLRMAASSFCTCPRWAWGVCTKPKQTVTSEILKKRHNFISPRGGTLKLSRAGGCPAISGATPIIFVLRAPGWPSCLY